MTRCSDITSRRLTVSGPRRRQTRFHKNDEDANDQKTGQTNPVTTARKDTNSTADKVNITVTAISPHCAIGAAASAAVSTGSAGKAAGVSLNIRGPFRTDTTTCEYSVAAMKDW